MSAAPAERINVGSDMLAMISIVILGFAAGLDAAPDIDTRPLPTFQRENPLF